MHTATIAPASAPGRAGHSAPWLVARLVATLEAESDLGSELRSAVGPEGIRDRGRLSLTLLGAITYATRAGCDQQQIRDFVDEFVRSGLAGERRAAVEDRCAERAATLVDVLTVRSALPG